MSTRRSSVPTVGTLINRYFDEVINRAKVDALERLVAEDVVYHDKLAAQPKGLEGLRQAIIGTLNAVPDLRASIDWHVDAGDLGIVRWTASGSYRAWPLPPVWIGGATIVQAFRASEGRLVEIWTATELGRDDSMEDDDDDGGGAAPAGPRWLPPLPAPTRRGTKRDAGR